MLFSACATTEPPLPAKKTILETSDYVISPVLYATDREVSGDYAPENFYGFKRSREIQYGLSMVSLPRRRKSVGMSIIPGVPGFSKDPASDVILKKVTPLKSERFWEHLESHSLPDREALVFVHGFNVNFEDAVSRTAQMAANLEFPGAVAAYSWPSQGSLSLPAYQHDETNIRWAVPRLKEFLRSVAGRAKKLHVIAHSMGNVAVANALAQLARETPEKNLPLISELILIAPDMDEGEFRNLAGDFVKSARRVTLYASSGDQALAFSRKIHGDYPRAGDSRGGVAVQNGVDSIDVSAVDTNMVGHFYYGDNLSVVSDLYHLVRGVPIQQRFGLARKPDGGNYWIFKPLK